MLFLIETAGASIIYTWIFKNTGGGVLLVTIFHASGNAFIQIPLGLGIDVVQFFLFQTVAVVSIGIVLVLISGPGSLMRVRPAG